MTAPTTDVECPECGCAFVNAAAFDAHRPGAKCVRPTDCGLVVAPRVCLTWSIPVRVPVDVERLRVRLQLLQLRDNLRPHLLRDNSTHRLTDLAQLDPQFEDVGAALTPVESSEIARTI